MKKTLMISMILSIIVLFLASCVASSSHNDSAFKLVRQAVGFDLYVSRGIDALEITLSGAHIYAETSSPCRMFW